MPLSRLARTILVPRPRSRQQDAAQAVHRAPASAAWGVYACGGLTSQAACWCEPPLPAVVSGLGASRRQMPAEPVARLPAGGFETLGVGLEMAAWQDDEFLGLMRGVEGRDGELRGHQVVALCHQQQEGGGAD